MVSSRTESSLTCFLSPLYVPDITIITLLDGVSSEDVSQVMEAARITRCQVLCVYARIKV